MIHTTIKRATEDIEERFNFNTAISAIMELVNEMYKYKEAISIKKSCFVKKALETLIILLAPFAPHVTEELWEMMGKHSSVHEQAWPTYDPAAVVKDEIEIVIQINGKVREKINVSSSLSKEELQNAALSNERISSMISGKEIVKCIAIPKKLVNIVVK